MTAAIASGSTLGSRASVSSPLRYLSGLGAALVAAGSLDRGACRAAAAARFSTERMVANHLDLYQWLLGLTPAQPQRRLRAVEG